MATQKCKDKDIEAALEELERIAQELEKPEIRLNDAIELFQKGTSLAKDCYSELKKAELKIKELKNDLSEIEWKEV